MELKEQFEAAAVRVKDLTSRPSNEDLLSLYALYKQATEGDVHGEKPGMFDFKGAAKYQAWESLKGKDATSSMNDYIALVNRLVSQHG